VVTKESTMTETQTKIIIPYSEYQKLRQDSHDLQLLANSMGLSFYHNLDWARSLAKKGPKSQAVKAIGLG
jgi:hypothetical protein